MYKALTRIIFVERNRGFKMHDSPEMVRNQLDFSGKIILAPMVRIGTLPTRLLALDYGADLVYTEELIDYRLLRCRRVENKVLGTVDFIDEDQNIVFRTCEKEHDRVILQMGTCDPNRALKVAKMVEKDVAGVDINMGCPKEFSLKGGMGAALLTQPEKIKSILSTVVPNVSVPVTCKIRVLPKIEDTVTLAKLIEKTGVKALAVHGRTKEERPQHANRNDYIKAVAKALSVPVIANGGSAEISKWEDIAEFSRDCCCSSVMLARQAEWNCSIFRKEGKLSLDDVIRAYLKYAIDYDNNVSNTKYCIQQMLGSFQETERGRALLNAQQLEEICVLWNMSDYYEKKQKEFQACSKKLRALNPEQEPSLTLRKRKAGDDDVWEMEAVFIRNMFSMDDLPKTVLVNWTRKKCIQQPRYITEQIEKHFRSIVIVDGKKYSTTYLEKNKKYAEQGAALVALYSLGLVDESKIRSSATGLLPSPKCMKVHNFTPVPERIHNREQDNTTEVKNNARESNAKCNMDVSTYINASQCEGNV